MGLFLLAMLGRTVLAIPGPTVTTQEVAGITRDATRESIELLFEGALIKHTSEHLGEGTYVQGTSIYAGTEYELAILWYDDGSIMQVRMLGDYWRTADGIGLGSTLTDLEAVLGTFEIAGFAWDNEGYANLWDTPYEGFFMRLLPPHGEIPPQFMGDSFFQSSQMRNLNPVVVDFRVEFY